MIKDKIKALLKISNKSNQDCAVLFNKSYASFTNKLNQRKFSDEELIKIADLTNTKLAFIDEYNNPVIVFDVDDIKKDTSQ